MPGTSLTLASPAAPAAGLPVPEALGPALRRALREGRGRVALRVEEPAPHRRRVARALLQEGALAAGGQVLDGPGGDLLLLGAEARRAERLRLLLERLVGPAATLVWSLERDAAALLAYAEGRSAAAPRAEGPGLAGLDAALAAAPLAGLVRRRQGLALAGGSPRPGFLRLEADARAVADLLGALADDADLLDHAMRRVAARLGAALRDPAEARALLGPSITGRLHLPLAGGAAPGAPALPPGRLVATLPRGDLAEPEALAARRAALAAAGIALELDGVEAAALGPVAWAAAPADLLRLHWSPGLDPAAIRDAGADRMVLAGAPGPEAASALGIALLEVS